MFDISNMSPQQKKVIYDILIDLSYQERNCYLSHHIELMSFQQIAESLQISKASVQTYIGRARKKIQKWIIKTNFN